MSKPATLGPNPTKLPLDKMPVDRLVEVLPEESPLLKALTAYVSPTPHTGTGDPNDMDHLATGSEIVIVEDFNSDFSYFGTTGNDEIVANEPAPYYVYTGAGSDTVTGLGTYHTFLGSGDDTYVVTDGSNQVYGGSGSDTIVTGRAHDYLVGGYGADTLTGGPGGDFFIYLSALDTGDVITDFELGVDHIDLRPLGGLSWEGLLSSPGEVQPGGVGYAPRAEGGITVFVDTDGIAGADLEIHVANVETIAASDFLF